MGSSGLEWICVWIEDGAVHVGEKFIYDYGGNQGYIVSQWRVWDDTESPETTRKEYIQDANTLAIEISEKGGLALKTHWHEGVVYYKKG